MKLRVFFLISLLLCNSGCGSRLSKNNTGITNENYLIGRGDYKELCSNKSAQAIDPSDHSFEKGCVFLEGNYLSPNGLNIYLTDSISENICLIPLRKIGTKLVPLVQTVNSQKSMNYQCAQPLNKPYQHPQPEKDGFFLRLYEVNRKPNSGLFFRADTHLAVAMGENILDIEEFVLRSNSPEINEENFPVILFSL